MIWLLMHPQAEPEHLGFMPDFFDDTDPRPAAEQLAERYAHGGGWHPHSKGVWRMRESDGALIYPGSNPGEDGEEDEVFPLIALARLPLSDETLLFFVGALLAVVKETDGSFDVTRVD